MRVGVDDPLLVGARLEALRPVEIVVGKEGRPVKDPVIEAHVDSFKAEAGQPVDRFFGVVALFKNVRGGNNTRGHADDGRTLEGFIVLFHAELFHPCANLERFQIAVGVFIDPGGRRPETDLRRNSFVEVFVHAVLSVMRHLADIAVEQAAVSPLFDRLVAGVHLRVAGEHDTRSAEIHPKNDGMLVDVNERGVRSIEHGDFRGADIEDVAGVENLHLFREGLADAVERADHLHAFLLSAGFVKLIGHIVQHNLVERDLLCAVFRDLVEDLYMVVVGMRQKPRVDVRFPLSGHGFQILDKVVRFRSMSAVDGDDLPILRGDDEAVADRIFHRLQHMDRVDVHGVAYPFFIDDVIVFDPVPQLFDPRENIAAERNESAVFHLFRKADGKRGRRRGERRRSKRKQQNSDQKHTEDRSLFHSKTPFHFLYLRIGSAQNETVASTG